MESLSQPTPLGQAASMHPQTEMLHDVTNREPDVNVNVDPTSKDIDSVEDIDDHVVQGCVSTLDASDGSEASSPEAEDDDSYEESEAETAEQARPSQTHETTPIAPQERRQQDWLMDVTPSTSEPKWPQFGHTIQNWLMTDSGGREVIPSLTANARLNIDVEFDHKINAYVIYRRNNITVERIECRLLVPDFRHATESLWIQQTVPDAKIPIKEFSVRLSGQFLHETREPILLQLVGTRPMPKDRRPKDIEINPQWAIMDGHADIERPKYAARVALPPGIYSGPAKFSRIQFGESTRKNRKNSRKQQDLLCLKVQLIARVGDQVAIISEIRSPFLMVRGKCPIFHSEGRIARVRKKCEQTPIQVQPPKDDVVPPMSSDRPNLWDWRPIAPRLPEQ